MITLNNHEQYGEIVELKVKQGLTNKEISEKLKIPEYRLSKLVSEAKEIGLISDEDIQKGKRNRKARERKEAQKNKVPLSEEEQKYKKACKDYLTFNFTDYKQTKKFNPVLSQKIELLSSFGTFKEIYRTILYCKANLEYASKKTYNSDVQRFSYYMAIIKNNIPKIRAKIQEQEKLEQGKNKNSESIVENLNNEIVSVPTERFDMSDLLDDF